MKVVINVCFGGFGLSDEAFEELIKKGWTVGDADVNEDWNTHQIMKHKESSFGTYSFGSGRQYESSLRSHPDLVEVVERLGEKSYGECAKLRVVEVPDGVEWEIDEYDGREHIAERHRTWG
jgi:hypothetical protein